MKPAVIPRISHPAAALVSQLSGHRVSPWYIFTRCKRGKIHHRPAYSHREDGGKGATFEVPAYDFHRALSLGVVEVREWEALAVPGESVEEALADLKDGDRVHVRVTPLGRAAHVVWEQRHKANQERAAAKLQADRQANARRPLLFPQATGPLPRTVKLGP